MCNYPLLFTHNRKIYFYFELDQAKNNMCNTWGNNLTNSHIIKSQSYLYTLPMKGSEPYPQWESIKVKTRAIEERNKKNEKLYFFKGNNEGWFDDVYDYQSLIIDKIIAEYY